MGMIERCFIFMRESITYISVFRASVMSGKYAGVQVLLRQRFIPNAIYVHCYAHKLNLVICDVTKHVPYLPEFYLIINKIFNYFHASSVTNATFKKVQQQLKIGKSDSNSFINVKRLFPSFGIVVGHSIKSTIDNYAVFIKDLEELEDEGTERFVDARSLLSALKEPLFLVTIFILHRYIVTIKFKDPSRFMF